MSTFVSFWNEHFSHIKIGSAAKDTCAKCWDYKRTMYSIDRQRRIRNSGDDDDVSSTNQRSLYENDCPDIGNERNQTADRMDNNTISAATDDSTTLASLEPLVNNNNDNNNSVAVYCPTIRNNPTVVALLQEPIKQEIQIDEWKKHCDEYRSQREYVIKIAQDAKTDYSNDIPWPKRQYSFCSDYCQNMDIPHFIQEQPSETYYYSPLNISCFGCCDFATDKLDAFVYDEGEGKKGGNNVCSLIYKKLVDDGIMDLAKKHGPGKQLTLTFDNCVGQNKNRMVLRFAQYLVDCCIFKRVEAIFLIMGHTKNICDRRFKDLKKQFHHKNVYTFDQLITTLSHKNERYVNVIPVNWSCFYDWDQYLTNTLQYKKAVKDVSKYHCFYYDTDYKGILKKQHTMMTNVIANETINKNSECLIWKETLTTNYPPLEDAPGIKEIKQVELYTKWRKLIPEQFQNIICPKPADDIIKRVKKNKADRAKSKKSNSNQVC